MFPFPHPKQVGLVTKPNQTIRKDIIDIFIS